MKTTARSIASRHPLDLFRSIVAITATIGLALILNSASLSPAWADNSDDQSSNTTASLGAAADWQSVGTCEWMIDDQHLIIRPANGSSSGELPSSSAWPWADQTFTVAVFQGSIKAGERLDYLFRGATSLTSIEGLANLDTSAVKDMSSMFADCSSLTTLDLPSLNTSNVTDMSSMFAGCTSLTSLDLSNFNTSRTTDMMNLFHDCSSLTSLDLSNLDTSNVRDMAAMFAGCSSLASLDVSPLNTSSTTDMTALFAGCTGLTSLDLSSLDTSAATNMSGMFYKCTALKSVNLANFDTAHVTDMSLMFANCEALVALDLSSFDTSSVTMMALMFWEPTGLEKITVGTKFTCQKELPNETWFNDRKQAFTNDNIPTGIAATYATSLKQLGVSAISIDQATAKVEKQKYTGKALTPKPVIAYGSITLEEGADYTLSYKDNTNPGYATITIRGIGNFSGSQEIKFLIEKTEQAKPSTPTTNTPSTESKPSTPSGTITNKPASTSPVVATGTWKKSKGKWWFAYDSKTKAAQNGKSYPANEWVKIGGKLYHFDSAGWMNVNWLKLDGKWYWLGSDGAMKTGWKKVKNTWYYMASNGVMQTGKKTISGQTYYLNPTSGAMKIGWNRESNGWYYYKSSGAMAKGWKKVSGKWYYLNPTDGTMKTGFYDVSGKRYYSNASGAMKTGWQKVNNRWYYFDKSGAMQRTKWVGNYYVGADGVMATNTWIGKYHVNSSGKWDRTAK